jgi:hypothetical protein
MSKAATADSSSSGTVTDGNLRTGILVHCSRFFRGGLVF